MFKRKGMIVAVAAMVVMGVGRSAAASLVPPVDPLCGGCDHSHQDHTAHDHDYETLISINLFGACLSHADFTGSNLTNAFLKGVDAQYATFREAQLMLAQIAGSNFAAADLTAAQLSAAELVFTDFTGAILRYANLSGANFTGATLVNADLRNTNLTGANLIGADLSGANLTLAKFIENAQSDGSTKYDVMTNFADTGFDPIAAGWTLSRAACCVNANCAVTDEATCVALGGTYDATATSCAIVACAGPGNTPGGCCLNGACIMADPLACAEAGGVFNGAASPCVADACGATCPNDVTGDGVVSFADILELITDWGPCGN